MWRLRRFVDWLVVSYVVWMAMNEVRNSCREKERLRAWRDRLVPRAPGGVP